MVFLAGWHDSDKDAPTFVGVCGCVCLREGEREREIKNEKGSHYQCK